MDLQNTYPRLRSDARLKRLERYAVVHGLHPSHVRNIHPSHALFLSLCSGAHSMGAVVEAFATIYGMSEWDALSTAQGIVKEVGFALELRQSPAPVQELRRADPFQFLYNGDDAFLDMHSAVLLPVPVGLNVTLTFACNFECVYCYQDLSGTGRNRLDLKRALTLADEAADMGVIFFGLTGGEPTLFKGWIDLVDRILAHGMVPVMTSNGTAIGRDPAIARHLRVNGMEKITISLDTADPTLHEQVTQSKSSFALVVNAIRYLLDAGIDVTVKSVLTPLTQPGVGSFIDFVAGLGVREIGINYMEPGAKGSAANKLQNVTPAQLTETRRVVAEKQNQYGRACIIYPPHQAECGDGDSKWYPCGGLYMGMSIFPNGNTSICDKLPKVEEFTYGNIFEQSLRDIWTGVRLAQIRARTVDRSRVDPECVRCAKLEQCRTSCFVESFKATGDYFAKNPHCGGPFAKDGSVLHPLDASALKRAIHLRVIS